MKISCQSCNAKYTIADEKVLGKIVKIRCKKCGATIVINGNEAGGSAVPPADDSNQDTRVFDYTTQQGASGDQWTVNVNDGDQRTMTLAEIVAEYKTGVVNDESFCWKDGMSDWLPLREIGELYAACHTGPRLSLTPEQSSQQDDMGGGNLGALFGSSSSGRGGLGQSPAITGGNGADAGANGNGIGALFGSATPSPVGSGASAGAARRAGGRGAVGDLFGAVEQAGGEQDAMAHAAKGMPEANDASKLTGQRNENSVLFSLSALTKNEPKESAPMAQGEGSGLIDIRALASAAPSRAQEGAKVDDIMNLAGGGAFSPALAAPVLAPPQMMGGDMGMGPSGESRGGSNKLLLIAILGGAALIAASIVIVFSMKKADAPAAASPLPTTTAAAASDSTGTTPSGATGTVAANDTAAAAAAAAPATGGAAPPSTGAAAHDKPEHTGSTSGAKASAGGSKPASGGSKMFAGVDSTPAAAPTPPPAAKAPAGLDQAMAASAGTKPAAESASAGSSAPFDRGAAAAALGAAAQAAGSCKKPDGPTGAGHVKVTFQPNGSVSVVDVDQPPFAGTSVGGCVAGKFKSAHVPAFAGSAVSVGKSFSIN